MDIANEERLARVAKQNAVRIREQQKKLEKQKDRIKQHSNEIDEREKVVSDFTEKRRMSAIFRKRRRSKRL